MTDFDEEVPEGFTKIIGHVCGLIFIFLAFLSAWAIYFLFHSPSIPALILTAVFVSLAWFFFSTAKKLTAGPYKKIINRTGYYFIVIFLLAFSGLILVAILLIPKEEFKFVYKLLSGLLALVNILFAFELIKYLKRKKR